VPTVTKKVVGVFVPFSCAASPMVSCEDLRFVRWSDVVEPGERLVGVFNRR
jgi:hypothetical protein